MLASMASRCASWTTHSASYPSIAARCSSIERAISRSSGFIPELMPGVFFADGRATTPPHKLGTMAQSSRALGLIAQRAPMIEPRATMAAVATKSAGQGMRLASSVIQARKASGSSASASNAGTGCRGAWIAPGAGHAAGSMICRTASACAPPISTDPPNVSKSPAVPGSVSIPGGTITRRRRLMVSAPAIREGDGKFSWPRTCAQRSVADVR